MINEKQLIETLKSESPKDPVLSAVLHVWASRERARAQVTVPALAYRMKEEGFLYSDAEYARVLRFMSDLGVGKLETSSTGKVRALKDVKLTLQSIGMAALGQAQVLQRFNKRNRFQSIPIIEAAPKKVNHTTTISPKITLEPAAYNNHPPRVQPRPEAGTKEWMVLCVKLSTGEVFKTYIPKGLTTEDAVLIGKSLSDMVR